MRYVLAVLLALVAAVLIVDLAVLGAPASAKSAPASPSGPLVYRQGTFQLQLTDRPCPFEELTEVLESEGIPPARVYEVIQLGQRRQGGCYSRDIGNDVMTLDLAGNQGTIPIEWFQRTP